MGIQDLLLKQMANFQQALSELYDAKKNFYWEKAMEIVTRNYDTALWKEMEGGTAFTDIRKKEALEFQLKLKYHELDILKATGKDQKDGAAKLLQYIQRYTAAYPDTYFYELENMKGKL